MVGSEEQVQNLIFLRRKLASIVEQIAQSHSATNLACALNDHAGVKEGLSPDIQNCQSDIVSLGPCENRNGHENLTVLQ